MGGFPLQKILDEGQDIVQQLFKEEL